MDIEEQELHYTPEAPLLGWRPEPPPWPEVASEARCYEDHPAPAAGCRCGIYVAVQGTLDSLPGYLLDTA